MDKEGGLALGAEDPVDDFLDDINFDQIDEDLAAFQEDEMVQQALSRGVDLQKYGRELEKELKQVCLYFPFCSHDHVSFVVF